MERRFEVRKKEILNEAKIKPAVSNKMVERLEIFANPFIECLKRPEPKAYAQLYIGGLLSDLKRKNVESIATRGPVTPDHMIRTKQFPVILGENPEGDIQKFTEKYRRYFERQKNNIRGNTPPHLIQLDPAPRFGIWKNRGVIFFGQTPKEIQIISDIL